MQPDGKWLREAYRPLRYARSCYRHLAGELGVQLRDTLVRRRCRVAGADGDVLTSTRRAWLRDIGLDDHGRLPGQRHAYACVDWSERREHLAGTLATLLLDHFLAQRWLVRRKDSRALSLTPQGRHCLLERLG
jgi:hypothetical protein